MTEIKRIYVRGTNWVGDAVMQIPALRALRRIFPNAEITLHTREWARGIFEDAAFLDEILTFEPRASKIETVFAQARRLREKKFDLAALFTNSFETALVAKIAGIPGRFGYAKDARSFLLTDAVKIPVWKNERHEVFYYLNLIGEIERKFFGTAAISAGAPTVDLPISDRRKSAARALFDAHGVDASKKIVALGVGSTNSRAKRWHADRFARLNDRLQKDLNASVILIGAPDEREVANEVYGKSKIKPTILTGKTTLAEAAAILSQVDLLVSNDMGLAHVASAAGAPTLVIFGPTNPLTTKPWNAEIVRKSVECAPCMLRDCPIDHRCMTGIAPDEVFERAEKMICDKIS